MIRFLRYAKRSFTEVQSELYVALDEKYISADEFSDTYELAGRTRAAIRGFMDLIQKSWCINHSYCIIGVI
jgi:four helix bundle protein